MQDLKVLSPSRIERLLELACAYNVPLVISTESKGETYQYKSRMLDIRRKPSANTLIIDHPVTSGPAIALKPDTLISVFFALERDRYLFESSVCGKTSFALSSRKEISVLEITYPNMLSSGDRRSYYRVPAPATKPISVDCGLVSGTADWYIQEPGSWNFPSHVQLQGHIIDISVGGMLLMVEQSDVRIPAVGTRLGLRFSLAPDETPVTLKGVVKRIEQKATDRRIGIQFIDTDEKFEYKLSINRLYRYVADRQRDIIKSGGK